MKTLELMKKLERYATFNLATFQKLADSSPTYARVYIHRLKKAGYVFELQKGAYTIHKDPLVVASRIVWPSYISLWSALRYHNLTEQLPHDVWVVTPRRLWRKEISFGDAKIIFVRTKPQYFFGYKKTTISNFEAFMAEPEKAILDGMLLKKISFSELAGIIKNNIKTLDMKRLISYAIETKNAPLIKRLGYLLDELEMDCYAKFRKWVSNSFVPLDYSLPKKGEKDEKWMIIKNMATL